MDGRGHTEGKVEKCGTVDGMKNSVKIECGIEVVLVQMRIDVSTIQLILLKYKIVKIFEPHSVQ